ncbi:ankyrin repeat domain-containing protein, partial [Endozoicomonas sp. ONNA2]|uniref:ankyrin repeat domain-containing protein n=1 Tax=Endozoicomonas sp. ONNA2 TaxID=2828741 RepID=UPI002147E091
MISGQIDHALQLIELEDPESTHSWHEANMPALHIAAFNGEKNLTKLLEAKGCDINRKDSRENTPLHYALSNHKLETAKTLLEFNANVNIRNDCGFTPLHLAAGIPECSELFTLLIEHKARVDIPDNNRNRPIHHAAEAGHELAVEMLIKNNADVNAIAHDGRTALHYAAAVFNFFQYEYRPKNSLALVRMLLNAGAKVELRSGLGYSAFDGDFWFRNRSDSAEVMKLLLSSAIDGFSDVNAPAGFSGRTLLYYALKAKDEESVQKLIAKGAGQVTDPGQNNAEGYPGSATNQRYPQHAPENTSKGRTQSHRFGDQKTSGSQHRAAPNVGSSEMAKVLEALEGLELRGRDLATITQSDVNKAFRDQALEHHPDKAVKPNESGDEFKKIVNYRDQLCAYIQFRDS